jgi:hypothetical protein
MITKKATSFFRNEKTAHTSFEAWVRKLEINNGRKYDRTVIITSLGKTMVWGLNTQDETLETLVIFPGARTTSLIWDFDRGLDNLKRKFQNFHD